MRESLSCTPWHASGWREAATLFDSRLELMVARKAERVLSLQGSGVKIRADFLYSLRCLVDCKEHFTLTDNSTIQLVETRFIACYITPIASAEEKFDALLR